MSDREDQAVCEDHTFLSVCCGAPEASSSAGFCAQCRARTVFQCECGAERVSRHD